MKRRRGERRGGDEGRTEETVRKKINRSKE